MLNHVSSLILWRSHLDDTLRPVLFRVRPARTLYIPCLGIGLGSSVDRVDYLEPEPVHTSLPLGKKDVCVCVFAEDACALV